MLKDLEGLTFLFKLVYVTMYPKTGIVPCK
jgi:hypothetical protein